MLWLPLLIDAFTHFSIVDRSKNWVRPLLGCKRLRRLNYMRDSIPYCPRSIQPVTLLALAKKLKGIETGDRQLTGEPMDRVLSLCVYEIGYKVKPAALTL